MDKDIKIGNLNVFQTYLLDQIWACVWACETEDQLRSWLVTLPTKLDQHWDEEEEDLTEAKECLKQFML